MCDVGLVGNNDLSCGGIVELTLLQEGVELRLQRRLSAKTGLFS